MVCQNCQQVIERLNINIDLFFEKLETASNRRPISEIDK
ncbi:hypothetical protein COO91_02087 [Nostoc flagelliforme CCNUN1]|uniref:Uncharacterized protein n=1 Tax=Nostoc flagelliforme CCNUN1 TaxID=2038116 RepID=A0A2K8SL26_9NOSO|nr:hypothetical protein COO91_02087 [Nostoc flagelliforme CCNUN1]